MSEQQDILERLDDFAIRSIVSPRSELPGEVQLRQVLDGAAVEIRRLRAIVSKLPLTADGVPVVPEVDTIYHPDYLAHLFMAMNDKDAADFFSPAGAEDVVCPVSDCYSTRAAAEAAKEATRG